MKKTVAMAAAAQMDIITGEVKEILRFQTSHKKLTISIERLSIGRALGEDDGCDDGGGARVKVDVRLLVTGKQEMRRFWEKKTI